MAVKSLKRANSKIRIKDLKLNALLEVTNAINNNLPKENLFQIYQFVLKDQLNIGKLALFTYDANWDCALFYGVEETQWNLKVEEHLLEIKEITEVNSYTEGHFKNFDVIIPVYHKTKALAYVLIGDLHEDAIQISPTIKHLPFIQTLTNIIAVAIENRHLVEENVRQERVKKELEFASEMQNMLLPAKLSSNEHFDISAFYQAHQQVGGDYYDFIRLNPHEVAFCIADVSGKGVSAAILMSNFQANLRVLVHHSNSLTDLVKALNKKVMENAQGEKFITFFVAKYNIASRVLTYVNAGHNPPLLFNDDTVHSLKTGCPGLGMLDEIPMVKEGIVNISKDSLIFCYTDGLVELENELLEEYGQTRIEEIMTENKGLSPNELRDLIIESATEFKGTAPYIDDIALLSCKFL